MCHLHKSDETVHAADVTNRFGVHAINLRTQNRTLWDSKAKLLISGYSVFNNYTLYPTGEIRPEPIKCYLSVEVTVMRALLFVCMLREGVGAWVTTMLLWGKGRCGCDECRE